MNPLKLQELAQTNGESGKAYFIGAALSAVGSIVGGKIASKDSRKNAKQAQGHSDYQLQNKHQWEVADLRKAGLNPVLSAGNYGNSAGSSPMAQAFNPADNVGNMTNSALGAQKLKQELKNMRATEKQIKSDARLKDKQGNVQDNIDRTTDIIAEGADALMNAVGGKGLGANTGKAVHGAMTSPKSPGYWLAKKRKQLFSKRKKQ